MGTSGSTDFIRTRDQIIARALRIIGALGMGDTPPTAAYTEGAEALNAIVKYLQTKGVRLWSQDWLAYYVSNADQCKGTDASNYICIKSGSGNDSAIPTTGSMWKMYWILGGSSGASIVSTVSYSPAHIFTPASNVLDIEKMLIRDDDDDNDVAKITMREYLDIPDKYTSSMPEKFVFEKGLTPKVYLYPIPDDSAYVIHYLATTALEDFDSSGDNPDMPVRYTELLTWMLASRLASEKRLTIAERTYIDQQVDRMWSELMRDDSPNVDMEFIRNAY
jgi:hypothetical protein